MIKASDYIRLPRDERRRHLDLNDPCLELFEGKTNLHHAHRGILAYFLGTTIPVGRAVFCCHACNNRKCANPKHMYWGTPQDNSKDYRESPNFRSLPQRAIAKHGLDWWLKLTGEASRKGGRGNRGKPKTEAHKIKLRGKRKGKPRIWKTGSRKGIKMPRYWARRGPTANKKIDGLVAQR